MILERRSASWMKKGDAVLMATYNRFPLVLEKGQGATIVDVDGERYLDFVSGIAVNALGHCNPHLVKVITQQSKSLFHVSNLYYNVPQIKLAELLTSRSFADRAFFCNSGAEANEAAIKLARKYAKASRGADCFEIIAMNGAFHGRTLAALSATGQGKYQKGFEPLLPGFRHVPFDDPEAIEEAITARTAAVLLEPIQGEAGVRIPTKGYLARVRKICDAHRLVLIFDEVQTGIGRTGRLFAYEHEGVAPDIITLAKGLGGGVPIGAMLATEAVAQAFSPGSHASTFGGNPLVCAAGVAVLGHLTENFLKKVRERGAYPIDRLAQLQKKTDLIKEVRGMGLLIGVDLAVPALDIIKRGHQKSLLLNRTSDYTLRLIPPLNLRKAEVDKMMTLFTDILMEFPDVETRPPKS